VRSFSRCRAASLQALLARSAARLGPPALVSVCGLVACGTDAERRYADLSRAEVTLDVGGYQLRYLGPPWKRLGEDPLVTGARTSVMVGGANREIVPESAAVLQVAKQSSASDPQHVSLPKYRLEAVFLRCSEDELEGDQSCAAALAQGDQAARADEGTYDLFGDTPRAGQNDFEQPFHEFMGKTEIDQRYQRIVFYETSARTLAARLFIEGNPDLSEHEVTRLVNAFELTVAKEEP
jgi:hypothetical protein